MPDFLALIKLRLKNPAISDAEIQAYIDSAQREISTANYSTADYIEQVLDTVCMYLANDNKFPEISSVSQNGLTQSYSPNDPERYRRRITERRHAMLLGAGAGY